MKLEIDLRLKRVETFHGTDFYLCMNYKGQLFMERYLEDHMISQMKIQSPDVVAKLEVELGFKLEV